MMVLTYMPALAFAEEKESADENAQPVAAEEVQEEAAPAEEPAPAKKAAPAVKSASEAKNANASGGYWESDSVNSPVYQDEEGLAHLEVEVNHYDYESEDDWPVLKFLWYEEGNDEPIAQGESIYGDGVDVGGTGEYYCKVIEYGVGPEYGDGDVIVNSERVYFTVRPYDSGDYDWWGIYFDEEDDVYCVGDTLNVYVEYDGTAPNLKYQWYKGSKNGDGEDYDWTPISGATGKSFKPTAAGEYRCEATDGDRTDSASCTVWSWKITNMGHEVLFNYGTRPTLTVKTNYTGSDISYKWYKEVDDNEVLIDNAKAATYTAGVNETGWFCCEVTVNGETQRAWYSAFFDTRNYTYKVTNPDATATYTTGDGRALTYSYTENGRDYNFPNENDFITVTNNGVKTVYTCDDDESFVSEDGEYLHFEYERPTAPATSIKANVYTNEEVDHPSKAYVTKYDINMSLKVNVTTTVKSFRFEPSSISLYSEDIKDVYEDGKTHYDFELRGRKTSGEAYINGDKLIVTYTNGKTRTFTYTSGEFTCNENGSYYYIYPSITEGTWDLKPGNNTVKLFYGGKISTISVFLDTPQLRAERAAKAKADAAAKAKEAARQGTPDKKIAKVKISKPSAGKKSVTAKWKKLTSKQIKKGKVKKYEIWVCPNKAFGPSDTIMKEVSKSKSSGKVKVPKKGKYYVKVRAIRKVGGVKYVGKWSSTKKVKVKK